VGRHRARLAVQGAHLGQPVRGRGLLRATPASLRPAGRLAALAPAQGLERFGVGKWGDISAELLPRWDDQALRVKAARLLGSQSLARYVAWKGTRWRIPGRPWPRFLLSLWPAALGGRLRLLNGRAAASIRTRSWSAGMGQHCRQRCYQAPHKLQHTTHARTGLQWVRACGLQARRLPGLIEYVRGRGGSTDGNKLHLLFGRWLCGRAGERAACSWGSLPAG
jgi:hypothetical protein